MLTKAKALVAEYWKVLEYHGELIVSKALLPKLKKDIKTALLTVSLGKGLLPENPPSGRKLYKLFVPHSPIL